MTAQRAATAEAPRRPNGAGGEETPISNDSDAPFAAQVQSIVRGSLIEFVLNRARNYAQSGIALTTTFKNLSETAYCNNYQCGLTPILRTASGNWWRGKSGARTFIGSQYGVRQFCL
jgi:hypothetical protein